MRQLKRRTDLLSKSIRGERSRPTSHLIYSGTFRLDKKTNDDLARFLELHPEVGKMNHLVNLALKEFINLNKNGKTWLMVPEVVEP